MVKKFKHPKPVRQYLAQQKRDYRERKKALTMQLGGVTAKAPGATTYEVNAH